MIETDEQSCRLFVHIELRRLLKGRPFASRFARDVGAALHDRLVDWPDEEETEFSRLDPVYALNSYLVGGWRLDAAWAADLEELPPELGDARNVSLSPVDHLACYGLWLLDVEYECRGKPSNEESNDDGWSSAAVAQYRSLCVALAYQALVFAQKLLLGDELSKEEIEKAARAATSRKAADALHSQRGGSRDKRAAILAVWATGKYSSRDICADQEAAALDMSPSTARKALINSPEPSSRSK